MPNRLLTALTLWAGMICMPALLSAQNNPYSVVITGPSVVCYGTCAQYSAVVTDPNGGSNPPAGLSFNWQYNGVTLNGGNSITLCFPPYGSGILFVSATSVNGTFAVSDTLFVNVLPAQPLEIISSNPAICNHDSLDSSNPDEPICERVCPYSTVTYSVTPYITGQQQVIWQVTGAQSYTVNPPLGNSVTVTWGGPGTGSVYVKTSPGSPSTLCVTENQKCVTIVEAPIAAFNTDPAAANPPAPLQICKGQTVWFDNQSLNADGFEWHFGDGSQPSAAAEPQHTYLNPGTYEVTLIARSACLCADTLKASIEVLDADAPLLDCVGTVCSGETVTYTASTTCANYVWTVSPNGAVLGGGSAGDNNVTVQWNDGPDGVVTLFTPACAGSACPLPSVTHVPVLSDNAEITGPERVCPDDQSIYYIEPFGGTNFVWTLSSGGTITSGQGTNHVTINWQNFPNPNFTHWLSVVYDNCYLGCGGRDSIPVQIVSPFIITGPVEKCEGSSAVFTAKLVSNLQNLNCNWTMTAPNGSVVWTGNNTPTANVTFSNGPGRYRLLAIPADPTQTCSSQAEWVVNVPAAPDKPTGIDGPGLICPGDPVTYTATGVTPLGNVLWTIQNGPGAPTTANGENLVVTWNASGPYSLTAQQVSTDGLGCISDTVRLDVLAVGSVSLSGATAVCVNSTGTYSVPALDNVDYQWQTTPADAGTIASGQGTSSVQIFWNTAGNHSVTVDVCGQTANFPVTVNGLPNPQVNGPAGLCSGATALVQTTTSFVSYAWENASGAALGNTPTITLGPGTYSVEVTDANGCVGSSNFNINNLPAPNFTISTNDPTAFCNNSLFVTMKALTTADGDYQYEWFLNGTPLGVNASSYTTNQYGLYTAQATNQFGCTATAGPIAIVQDCGGGGGGGGIPGGGLPPCPPGAVTLTISPTPQCDSFQFVAGGFDYLAGSGQWTFAQSGASIFGTVMGDNVPFVFPNAGGYVTVLIAQLQSGGTCRLVDSVDVEAVAAFDPLPECPGQMTAFQDISTFLPGSNITGWQWNFGDPGSGASNSSMIRNATHVFGAGGNYTVTLTVTALSGCTSTGAETVTIETGPAVSFVQPAIACAGDATEFTATVGADVNELSWNFGDPGSGAANTAGGVTAFHHYNLPGNYTVTATATNAFDCATTFSQTVTISANSLSGNVTPATPAPFCEGASVILTAPGGAVSYMWSDSTTTTPTFIATEEGAYSVTLTDANGCTYAPPPVIVNVTAGPDGTIKALLTNDLGQVIGVSYPTLSACAGDDVTLQAFGTGNYTYMWSNSVNGNQNIFSQGHGNLLSVGTHVFTITVTDVATGCTSVGQPFTVEVHPVPSGFFVSSAGFCAGATTLTYNGPTPANWQIAWNTGATGSSLVVDEGGNYFVQVVNEFGCEGQSNVVTVLPGPPDEAIPSGCHTRCNPDTLCLPPMPSVIGWQWYYNGTPIPGATTSDFVATQSGTYWAQLTDIYGCSAQSGDLVLDLFNGFGDILGQVWSDVNGNGMIDAGDTLVSGIAVNLWQNGVTVDNAQSNSGGDFAFAGIPSTDYSVALDTALLPAGWNIVIGQDSTLLQGCGVQANADLLISPFCATAVFDTVQLNACSGGSALYNGTAIAAGASQSFQFVTPAGCDSTVTVNVGVLMASSGTVNANACPGSSFNYNGTLIPAGQSQQVTLTNYLGCDSVVTVNVATLTASTATVDASACPGSTFDYNGTLIPAGQSQQFTLTNFLGCDSIVTVNVATLPVSTGTVNASACPGSTFDYNGTLIPAGQSQQFTLTNFLGCDSIVTVNVATLPVSTGTVNASACPGSTFDYNGTLIPAGQSQQFTLSNFLGCDSIVTVNVAVLPVSTGTVNASACPGSAFDYNGTLIPAGQSQQFTLTNSLGCDSVVTVIVATLPVSTATVNASACPGSTFDYNGTLIPAGQSQQFTLTNYLGCDSVVTVNVAISPTSTATVNASACPGSSFDYNGTLIPAGQSQQFILTNYLNCDSVVTVNVAVAATSSSTLNTGACAGESYDFNGTLIPAGQSQQITLTNALGCDSVVTVNVAVWPSSTFKFSAQICPGESFNFNGTLIPAGDTAQLLLTNYLGCDSIVTITVAALPVSASTLDVPLCPGEVFEYGGVTMVGGDTLAFVLQNQLGCDSTVTVNTQAYPDASFALAVSSSCPDTTSGSLTAVGLTGGTPPFNYSLDGSIFQNEPDFDGLAPGDYTVYLQDANGCVFERDTVVDAYEPLQVSLANGILACDSSGVRLAPILFGDSTGVLFTWSTGEHTRFITVNQAGPVWVEITNRCGTQRAEAVVNWADIGGASLVYVPNVVAPAAENPDNALFKPFFPTGLVVQQYVFRLYDRWGNWMWEAPSPDAGWESLFRTRDMQPGVYVWYLEATVDYCGRVMVIKDKGDVTIVR